VVSHWLSRELGVYMKKTKILRVCLGVIVVLALLFAAQPITRMRLWDTDYSNYVDLRWNEDGASNYYLNFLVNGGTRSLTIEADSVINSDLSTDADWSTSGSMSATKGFIHGAVITATPSGAFTVDWTVGLNHQVTITGENLDITFTNPSGPCRLTLKIIQGDGDDTIDWTNEADLKFPGKVDPVLSTGSGDVDLLTIWWDGFEYVGVANYDIG